MRRLFGIVVIVSAGCVHATMIPVAGPLSQTRPIPSAIVTVKGILGNSGSLSFPFLGGVTCKGRWSSAAGAGVTVSGGTLIGQYGSAYLSGYSVSTGTGQNPGQALATCSDGRAFQIDFVTGAGTAHGYGIGKDSDENIYRFVF